MYIWISQTILRQRSTLYLCRNYNLKALLGNSLWLLTIFVSSSSKFWNKTRFVHSPYHPKLERDLAQQILLTAVSFKINLLYHCVRKSNSRTSRTVTVKSPFDLSHWALPFLLSTGWGRNNPSLLKQQEGELIKYVRYLKNHL